MIFVRKSVAIPSSEYDWYNVTVDCSNLEDLTNDEIISLDAAMNVSEAYINGYTSNGNMYQVYDSSRSIYKNGKEFYNDYWNSESHKSVQEQNNSSSYGSSSYTQTPTENEMGYAWAVAEREIKERLKAPSTAKFPTYNHATIKKNGNKFKVIGYVDAENSFGTKLRVNFTVEFEKTGSEYYKVISATLDE